MIAETYVRCSAGHHHWGAAGAAGLLLAHRDAAGTVSVLLQRRGDEVHNGGTYAWLGGALDAGETRLQAARREAAEEAGLTNLPAPSGFYVEDHGTWSYTTFLVLVDEKVTTTDIWEGETSWYTIEEARSLPLIPGAVRALVALTGAVK